MEKEKHRYRSLRSRLDCVNIHQSLLLSGMSPSLAMWVHGPIHLMIIGDVRTESLLRGSRCVDPTHTNDKHARLGANQGP